MVKKLIGCGIAATLAASLWSTIPKAQKKVLGQIRGLETTYRAALYLCDVDPDSNHQKADSRALEVTK